MFKKLDRVTVKLDSIDVEKGFKSRMKEPHVKELAASIAKLGLLEDILVREKHDGKGRHIVAGRDRLAALMLNDVKSHVVQLVQGTDLECRRAELEENLLRRRDDNYDDYIRELVDITAQEMQEEHDRQERENAEKAAKDAKKGEPKEKAPAKKGRKKELRTAAMEAVAKATRKTPEAVRQADKRSRTAEVAKSLPPRLPTDSVETWGIELTPRQVGELVHVVELQDCMAVALADLKASQRKLKEGLNGKKDTVRSNAYAMIAPAMESAAEVFKTTYKTAVCPYCCLVEARMKDCTACYGVGFVGPTLLEHVPAELKKKGKGKLVLDGKGGYELLVKPAELTTERDDAEVPEGL